MASYGAASTKQLRLRQPMCNTDRLDATTGAAYGGELGEAAITGYLRRSARLMGELVREPPNYNVLRVKVTR